MSGEETTEQRKARLAALRQSKSGSVASSNAPVDSSPVPTSASLGSKRKEATPALGGDDRLYEGQDEIIDVEDMAEVESSPQIQLRFRNYKPRDEDVKEKRVTVIDKALPVNVDEKVATILSIAKQAPLDPFLNIAPKKLNWDLKREVADRLETLRKRTHKAINDIVLEKMLQLDAEAEADAENDRDSDKNEDSERAPTDEEIQFE